MVVGISDIRVWHTRKAHGSFAFCLTHAYDSFACSKNKRTQDISQAQFRVCLSCKRQLLNSAQHPQTLTRHSPRLQSFSDPEDCKDDCLQMYSMCDDMYESIAVLEKSRRYCANMVENPEDFLKTSNGSWAPIGNGSCGENEQFCPLAFGCISRDSKCPGLGGLLPSMKNVTAEEEDEDDWESTPEGPPAPKLAWQTRCPAGFVYCEIADRCVPDRTYCMLHHVIALMAMNNSKLNQLFNISCPPEHRFCLGEGRCIPKGEKCALFQLPYSALMSLPGKAPLRSLHPHTGLEYSSWARVAVCF